MKVTNKFLGKNDEKEFCGILARLKNPDEIKFFLNDLLTSSEKSMILQRWTIAKMFNKGWTYDKIHTKIKASYTTIHRVNNIFNSGSNGYQIAIKKLDYKNIEKKITTKQKASSNYELSNLEKYIKNRIKKGK